MSIINRTIKFIEERRNNAASGRFNSIPSPFKRFSSQYVGIERGTYYLVTASPKIGKTQITSFLFIFSPLLFCYKYSSIDFKVFYFPFEETPERVTARWISFLLYELYDIEVDYQTLMSTSNNPLEKSILDLINSEEMQKYLRFFEERVIFVEDEKNPTGIYKYMKNYAEENGTTYYTEYETKDEFGITQTNKKFSHYIPKNPNSYTLFVADHISLVECERGYTLKQSIDKLSEYCVILRNRYHLSPVLVHQQIANETADNFKQGLVRPTLSGLGDSKYTARDCTIALGLHSPFRAKEQNSMGYDVTVLKDRIRILEVLANRNGETGGIVGLYFKGNVSAFKELPKPNDPEIQNVYKEELDKGVRKTNTDNKNKTEGQKFFSFFMHLINKKSNG